MTVTVTQPSAIKKVNEYPLMISRIAMIVFFLVYGINAFVAVPYAGIILGISALVAAIALIARS